MPIAESLAACALTAVCAGSPLAPADHMLNLALTDTTGKVSTVRLFCDPVGGSHPAAVDSCGALTAVNGSFDQLPSQQRACVLLYSPVEATAQGRWGGERVFFQATYPNRCVAGADTAGVFDF